MCIICLDFDSFTVKHIEVFKFSNVCFVNFHTSILNQLVKQKFVEFFIKPNVYTKLFVFDIFFFILINNKLKQKLWRIV